MNEFRKVDLGLDDNEQLVMDVEGKYRARFDQFSGKVHGFYAYLSETIDEFHRGRIPFDVVDFDTDNFFDLSTHQMTVPEGMAGVYQGLLMADAYNVDDSLPIGNLGFQTSAEPGGASLYMPRAAGDTSWVGSVSTIVKLAEGDTLAGSLQWTTEDDDLSVTLFGEIGGPNFFSAVYLGPI